MKFVGVELTGQDVDLDANEYIGCELIRCKIFYSGIPSAAGPVAVRLKGNTIDDCSWHFVGPAAHTLALLRDLYNDGFTVLIDKTIETIRTPRPD